jgi:hypothetical protein
MVAVVIGLAQCATRASQNTDGASAAIGRLLAKIKAAASALYHKPSTAALRTFFTGGARPDDPMSFPTVLAKEYALIRERRRNAKYEDADTADPRTTAVGLALSGGGIRSATFSLGVLQALDGLQLLRIVDYLSTVSGGGFVGGWWSAWLSRVEREEGEHFPPEEGVEPERREQYAARVPDGAVDAGKDPIHHLRLFSNYLTPRKGLLSGDTWRGIAVVSRNLILTWLVLVPVFLITMLLGQLTSSVSRSAMRPSSILFTSSGHLPRSLAFPMWRITRAPHVARCFCDVLELRPDRCSRSWRSWCG